MLVEVAAKLDAVPFTTVTSPTTKPVTASEKVAVTVNRPEKVEAVVVKATVGAVVSMAVFVFVKIVPEPEPSNPNL